MNSVRISKGADAASHPTGAALKAAGIQAIGVYLTGRFATSAAILEDYLAHGIWCFALYEVKASAAAGGAAAGLQDMALAIAAARPFHVPPGAVLILCDDDSSISEQLVLSYWAGGLKASHAANYRCGGYGPHDICTAGLGAKVIDAAMVAGGWESGKPQTGIAIKQMVAQTSVGGVTCDVDEILLAETPGLLWNLRTLYVPPAPPHPPIGDDVTLHDVKLTTGSNGVATLDEKIPFAKVVSWSVVGGAGPHDIVARCQASADGTSVSVQGAAPSQVVTVRLSVLG